MFYQKKANYKNKYIIFLVKIIKKNMIKDYNKIKYFKTKINIKERKIFFQGLIITS